MISWVLFLPACFALNASPGPNNMTAFVNGARMPLLAAIGGGLGRIPAFAILIGITAVGLGALLEASASAFWIIKLLGAAYLIYIGVKLWRTPAAPIEGAGKPRSAWTLARQDFTIAISNPKAIAIFTAFFPQFIEPSTAVTPQILMLGAVFLILECLAMSLYAIAGKMLSGAVRSFGGFGVLNKAVGGFLVFSGVSLAASSR